MNSFYYRAGDSKKWISVDTDDSIDIWIRNYLYSCCYQDSDDYYTEYVEVCTPDDNRIYGYAEYQGWLGNEHDGCLEWYVVGTFNTVKKYCENLNVGGFSPTRDWIILE